MKSLSLNVPDEQAQAFAKELATLLKKHGVEVENKEVIDSLLPITERVKTFDDAVNILGVKHPMVTMYEAITNLPDRTDDDKHFIAYVKLCIITAALNEGWKPTFDEDEYRYYPRYAYYTEKEIAAMDDDEKKRRCLWGAHSTYGARSGLGSVASYLAWSRAAASCASRLAYKTSELADYSARQFIDIWANYVGKF